MHDSQNPMNNEPAPRRHVRLAALTTHAPSADLGPATPQTVEGRGRRLRVATLLNSVGLLCTTTLIATLDPKIPPFRGD